LFRQIKAKNDFPGPNHFHDGGRLARHRSSFRHRLLAGIKRRADALQSVARPTVVLVTAVERGDERPGIQNVFHAGFLFQVRR
jgi:hypothetical protein